MKKARTGLHGETFECAKLDNDPDLAGRYRKLNAQLDAVDHKALIEKLRASAAVWDQELSE